MHAAPERLDDGVVEANWGRRGDDDDKRERLPVDEILLSRFGPTWRSSMSSQDASMMFGRFAEPPCTTLVPWWSRSGPANRGQSGAVRVSGGQTDQGALGGEHPGQLVFPLGVGLAPSAGFEPAHTAPEADALSPELRGRGGTG
jgi:hypothetical protein